MNIDLSFMTSLKIDLQQSHIDVKIFPTKIDMHTKQAKFINALRHQYESTRPNSHEICAQTYTIKLFEFSIFMCFQIFYTYKNKSIKVRSNVKTTKTMHIKRCMSHKCMTMKHLMHERSYKDRKNQIKDQKNKSSTIGTLPHPNRMIVCNECLMRREMRVGRMRIGDAHRQGVKSIKHFF